MEQKRLTARDIKASPSGEFTALAYLCTGEPDLDGDIILPSAFTEGEEVVISQWGHSAWGDSPPAGRGRVHIDGNRILVQGKFFMDTRAGRETYNTVKQLGDRCEFSIGFFIEAAEDLN